MEYIALCIILSLIPVFIVAWVFKGVFEQKTILFKMDQMVKSLKAIETAICLEQEQQKGLAESNKSV